MELSNDRRSLTPHYPTYGSVCGFLRALDGIDDSAYGAMYKSVWDQRGTPQDTVDWKDPDVWIGERLTGESSVIAKRLWSISCGLVNPRYTRGIGILCQRHELQHVDDEGFLRTTDRGAAFLADSAVVISDVDRVEGLDEILRVVAERGPATRKELQQEFAEFCRQQTTWQRESAVSAALLDRLNNLIDRRLVAKQGRSYEATPAGLQWLELLAVSGPQPDPTASAQANLKRVAQELSKSARERLAAILAEMDPYDFEKLIQRLLTEMEYSDVAVTSKANDKGVDVVGRIEMGITSVREVVQVKRTRSNIGRRTLDELRGSLHRFDALQGTIITLGGFAKGTIEAAHERGAAPITLIDGARLLALLVEKGIGVQTRTVDYLVVDPADLAPESDGDEGPVGESPAGTLFVLTSVAGVDGLSAADTIRPMLEAGWYAFAERTPTRTLLKPGDRLCFYGGSTGVFAEATIQSAPEKAPAPHVRDPDKFSWRFAVVHVRFFDDQPVRLDDPSIRSRLEAFRRRDPHGPWGWFVQGTHSLSARDFHTLTGRDGD